MHAVMMTTDPPLVYWNAGTIEGIHRVRSLRRTGVGVFFTIDAGPQIKAVCLPGDTEKVRDAFDDLPGVRDIHVTGLGPGATYVPS